MKKNVKSPIVKSPFSGKSEMRAIKAASKDNCGAINRIFYVDRAEFDRLRAELERPAKPDERLIKLLKGEGCIKWAAE